MQFILFDVVNYSSYKSVEQKPIIKIFTQMISNVLIQNSENDCLKIPCGDGVILCFREESNKVLKIVQGVMEKVKNNNKEISSLRFELRCAISYGMVLEYQDINDRLNLSGTGINNASRILSKSGKNQILVSADFYKLYTDLGIIPSNLVNSGCFSEPFSVKAKHDENIDVRNFFMKEADIGIPHSNDT